MPRKSLLIAAAICLVSTVPALAAELTAQEIMETHIGKCTTYSGPTSGTQCYTADGRTTYDDATYGQGAGDWSLRDNELCVKYPGEPIDCGPITRVSGNQYSDGTYTWVIN